MSNHPVDPQAVIYFWVPAAGFIIGMAVTAFIVITNQWHSFAPTLVGIGLGAALGAFLGR